MARKPDPDALSMISKPLETESRNVEDMLTEARERSMDALEGWRENFDLSDDDVRFTEGLNQWSAADAQERNGRPMLTLNTVPQFIGQLVGEQRQNSPSIHVHPDDDLAAKAKFAVGEGKTLRSVDGATVLEGMIRAIEYKSGAEAWYDKAISHAYDGAFGWLRVYTQYANQKDFDQRLLIGGIKNRWSALIDPTFQQPDAHDMGYAFIHSEVPRREFERRYPKAMQGTLTDEKQRQFWQNNDTITVTEYMTREAEERTLLLLGMGDEPQRMEYLDEVKDDLQQMQAQGWQVIRERKVVDWVAVWRKITAFSLLEGPIKLPFTSIPLIPVFGRERNLRDGRTLYSSIVRHAKDAKRMENFWLSAATERVSMAPKAPWLLTDDAIEGHEDQWERLNAGNPAYLTYNAGAEKPDRQPGPQMPAAEVQMAATMGQMVKSTMGMYDANLMQVGDETSGKALNARQHQVRAATFEFTDNLNWALRRIGLLLIEAIPKIYDTERKVSMRGKDGSSELVNVNQQIPDIDPATGEQRRDAEGELMFNVINGLGQGEFGVIVSAGPSYATQRQEAAETSMQLIQAAPNLAPAMADTMVENMDFPGADKSARRLKAGLMQTAPWMLTAAEKDELAEEMGGGEQVGPDGQPMPEQPDPAAEMQAAMAELQMKVAAKDADASMATADAKIATAEATKAKAQADMAEQAVRMQALQMSPPQQPPNLPTAQMPNGGGA